MSVSWSPRLVVLLALVGAACHDPAKFAPERPESEFSIFFPTVPRQDSYPAAVIEGTLEARNRCLFVTRDGERWLVLWPKGYRPLWDGVRLRVFGEKGALVGQAGEPIRLVGGEERPSEVGGAAAAERWASELTGLPMPDRCGDLYWIVSRGSASGEHDAGDYSGTYILAVGSEAPS